MCDSSPLTSRELMRVRLFLFDKQLWEVEERIHPLIPLTPRLLHHRAREVQSLIQQAELSGIIFEPNYAEDVLQWLAG